MMFPTSARRTPSSLVVEKMGACKPSLGLPLVMLLVFFTFLEFNNKNLTSGIESLLNELLMSRILVQNSNFNYVIFFFFLSFTYVILVVENHQVSLFYLNKCLMI